MAEFLTYSTFVSLLNARGFIGDAISEYYVAIGIALTKGLFLLVGIWLKPNYTLPLSKTVNISSPAIGLLLFTGLLFMRGGDGGRGMPGMFVPLSYANLYLYDTLAHDFGERKAVNINRQNKVVKHDIILIIDESIRGDYLDINSDYGVKSNLHNKPDNIVIFNYGLAASITNCSTETNVTLRYGGTRTNYLEINNTMPSIWQYAKKAGLKNVYIDAQRTGGKLQNKMDELELKDIDKFIQFDGTPVQQRDIEASKLLVELINNDEKEFVIVNKIGAHFPIHDKYPDEFLKYKPVLSRGNFLNITDTGSREGFKGGDDWLLYRNSYRNTLLWNVGEFFSFILSHADLNKAVIIYTSDHGQDLHERGNPGLHTHCTESPNIEEGIVPLVILTGNTTNAINWGKNLSNNYNRSSHYNIFPTLLELMLYEKQKVLSSYGVPLSDIVNGHYAFNAQYHAKFGKKPKWIKIIKSSIAKPNNDYMVTK